MGLIFFFSGYCISTLTIMKLKYVWPVHVVKEVMETTPFPNFPFSMEQSIENMVRGTLNSFGVSYQFITCLHHLQ